MREASASDAGDALQRSLARALRRRERLGTLRRLQVPHDGLATCTDFFSNDYLGLARDPRLLRRVQQRRDAIAAQKPHLALAGATGSRLISGNNEYFLQVEEELARFYDSEAALLFNSGYAANLGVLSSLPQAQDVVLYDELIHNSCHEGLRLSRASASKRTHAFRHNDLSDLERMLQQFQPAGESGGCVFVVVESVYSMDGDVAPLAEMVALCERYGAYVIVDEAHGVGVYGPNGSGVVRGLGLDTAAAQRVICCRVYTFGKALGCHGAVVCASRNLIEFLVNYARSFIYTTAFPFEQLVTVQCAHELCEEADDKRAEALRLVQYFQARVTKSADIPAGALLQSDSPIQGVVFSGNHAVLEAARQMLALGIRVIPIRSPTVPKGAERFRIIIHAHNTEGEIDQLVAALEVMFRQRIAASAAAAARL